MSDDAAARIRTLLLRGDNLLKSGRPERLGRAVEAFEEARTLAQDAAVDPRVRELVDRRLEAAKALIAEDDAGTGPS